MKTAFLAPTAVLLLLAGCGQAQKAPSPGGEAVVSDGRLVLPAVSGSPAAAYFTVHNDAAKPAAIAAVSVQGAVKAEMHETSGGSMSPITILTLGPGATAEFVPGGKHVMVFGVSKTLKPGDASQITLVLSGGKKIVGPLKVEAPGGDMAGMTH